MGIPMDGFNHSRPYEKRENQANDNQLPLTLSLMLLDLAGFVLIFIGLAQQYNRIDVLPHSLSFTYSGLAVAALGLLMTLPFLAWTLIASKKVLEKISL